MRISDVVRRDEVVRAIFHPNAEMYMSLWGSGGPRPATLAVTTQRLLLELALTRVGSDAVLSYDPREIRRVRAPRQAELRIRVPHGYTLHLTFDDSPTRDVAVAAVLSLMRPAEPATKVLAPPVPVEERLQALRRSRDSGAISQRDFEIEAARLIAARQD